MTGKEDIFSKNQLLKTIVYSSHKCSRSVARHTIKCGRRQSYCPLEQTFCKEKTWPKVAKPGSDPSSNWTKFIENLGGSIHS